MQTNSVPNPTASFPLNNFKIIPNTFRNMTKAEISILIQNQNHAADWETVFIREPFDLNCIRNSTFWGTVYLDSLEPGFLEYDQIPHPVGIYDSTLISCAIGRGVSVRSVNLLVNYQIEDGCILFNIDELSASAGTGFGNGYLRPGQKKSDRLWIEAANENGGRRILPFAGMLPADAFLWSKYPHDKPLLKKFTAMTDLLGQEEKYACARVAKNSVIRNSTGIKNMLCGENTTIESALNLKNITIQSTAEEPTFIGAGVNLKNGVIGYGNTIDSNVIAENFLTGRNVKLQYGVRFINTILGPNSTISCCEVLSNLIFPFHEQHHNNSFLIASTVMGQSNIAAGATIGSNHNSRAADGEILAERGFWPGLNSTFKHNSKFAAFTLIAKGNYNAELNISLPFSLISPAQNSANVQVFPGFWFKYNMYALARNTWKFKKRDKRKIKQQFIETDYLAPDTVEEMVSGISILKTGLEEALQRPLDLEEIIRDYVKIDKQVHLTLDGMINKGKAEIIKPAQGIYLYRMMILLYGGRELLRLLQTEGPNNIKALQNTYREAPRDWMNLGGMLVAENDVRQLLEAVKTSDYSWEKMHQAYAKLANGYAEAKARHSVFTLLNLFGLSADVFTAEQIKTILDEFATVADQLLHWAYESRKKDYAGDFRIMTYTTKEEMNAVLGTIEENEFLIEYEKEMNAYQKQAKEIALTLGA